MRNNIKKDDCLKMIVESFIKYGLPVGSENLIKQNNLAVSSATIRNIMALLEKEGFIEKHHTSSGRVPSIKGIKYYANELTTTSDDELMSKLKDIFSKRRVSIDETIEEASKAIANFSQLTFITSNTDYSELLKSITLTEVSPSQAVVVLITSTGRVENKNINLNKNINTKNLSIAVRFMQERLVDFPISELSERVIELTPIFKTQIKNAEELVVTFVNDIFYFVLNNNRKIYGKSFIIESEDISRKDLSKLINRIENESIWDSIQERSIEGENLKIDIGVDNTSLISKKITIGNSSKEMSIIGTHRMDYSKAKNILNIIEKFLKE
ncbi:MAG: heat-inducible transcriptional repressor HrcA [Mycoplasmataceae bacterium]|nr:heat-inducible transcriptional repressor HrcA [Mycoplasmataceae bacterium]